MLIQQEDKQVPVTPVTTARVGTSLPAHHQSRSVFGLLSGLLARLGLIYVLVAALWRCPSQPFSFQYNADHELLVCRELASAQEHIAPAVAEMTATARKHLDPYVGTYINKAEEAWSHVRPIFGQTATHANTIFTSHVRPGAYELAKQAHTWSAPHRRTAHKHYKKHLHPHVDAFHKAAKPYVQIYRRDVEPHVKTVLRKAHEAHNSASKYYEKEVHPRLKAHLYNGYLFTRHTAFPLAHKHYFAHAHPHLTKVYRIVSKRVDDVLVKYGLRNRSVLDSVVNNVKETYRQTDDAVREKLNHVASTPSMSVSAEPVTTETASEEDEKLQKRLDEELEHVDKELNKELSAISQLVKQEHARLEKELVDDVGTQLTQRRRLLLDLPEAIVQPHTELNDYRIPHLLDAMLLQYQDHAAMLQDPEAPSAEWHSAFNDISANVSERLASEYDWMRAHLSEVLYRASNHTDAEEQKIQGAVAKIRKQLRQSVNVYYELMDAAEFQVTFYDNEGFDTGIKRRARMFRDDMRAFLKTLSPFGEPVTPGRMVLPNVEEERQQALVDLNALMWELEKLVANITARIAEHPALLLDRAGFGGILVDIYQQRQMIKAISVRASKRAALRLRKYVGDANEKLGLPRKPTKGLLLEVWDEPSIVGTEDYAIPTSTASQDTWTSARATYDPASQGDWDETPIQTTSQTAHPTESPAATTQAMPRETPDVADAADGASFSSADDDARATQSSVHAPPPMSAVRASMSDAASAASDATATVSASASDAVSAAAQSASDAIASPFAASVPPSASASSESTPTPANTATTPFAATPLAGASSMVSSAQEYVTEAAADAATDAASLVAELLQGFGLDAEQGQGSAPAESTPGSSPAFTSATDTVKSAATPATHDEL